MQRWYLKVVLALLLGWYFVGPLVETVDRWDSLGAEIQDIARSAGGSVTLVLAGFVVGVILLRVLTARCSSLARSFQGRFHPEPFRSLTPFATVVELLSHSPPSPLRI